MSASILLQSLIIGACVFAAAAYALRNVAPAFSGWLRNRTADALARSGHAEAAARLRPPVAEAASCGTSGGACSSCGNCGPDDEAPPKEHKLVFHGRR